MQSSSTYFHEKMNNNLEFGLHERSHFHESVRYSVSIFQVHEMKTHVWYRNSHFVFLGEGSGAAWKGPLPTAGAAWVARAAQRGLDVISCDPPNSWMEPVAPVVHESFWMPVCTFFSQKTDFMSTAFFGHKVKLAWFGKWCALSTKSACFCFKMRSAIKIEEIGWS